jgi:hypothetical protein
MSMLLVNKQGIDTTMEIEEDKPKPAAAAGTEGAVTGVAAAGGCEGTYMALSTAAGKHQPPVQLHAAASAASRKGGVGEQQQVVASQFAGRTDAPWSSGVGEVRGSELTMTFESSSSSSHTAGSSSSTVQATGTISDDCGRIEWSQPPPQQQADQQTATAVADAAARAGSGVGGSTWVRIRPAGRWNLFIAAGALLGNTAFYLWDTSGASLLWTLLDPEVSGTEEIYPIKLSTQLATIFPINYPLAP